MTTVWIEMFRNFTARYGEEDLGGIEPGKVQELFCYLLLHRDCSHHRETLAGLLWADLPSTNAKKNLRQAIWHLQTSLAPVQTGIAGERLLKVGTDSICLNSRPNLQIDVAMFDQAFAETSGTSGPDLDRPGVDAIERAIGLYRGDLLEGWGQEWCLYERTRLQTMYLSMLDKLMAYGEAHHVYQTALAAGRRILLEDRAHERTHRRMMRLHFLVGDRTAALRQFETCVASLKEELGVRPAKRTVTLYEQIRADQLDPALPGPPFPTSDPRAAAVLPNVLAHLQKLRRTVVAVERQLQRDIESVEQALKLDRP